MSRYLLDSDTCIEHLRRSNAGVARRMQSVRRSTILLCSVVVGELLYGAFHSRSRRKDERAVRKFLERFSSVPFDDRAAQQYAKSRAALAASGQMIGSNDLQIAAIAMTNDLVLVTHNTSEFGRVRGLKVEDWHE